VVAGEWYAPLQAWEGQLCGVLSNPPYIDDAELPGLQAPPAPCRLLAPMSPVSALHLYQCGQAAAPFLGCSQQPNGHALTCAEPSGPAQAEVRLHEPSLALDGGGEQGLSCLLNVCSGAVRMLRPAGFLGVETAGARPHTSSTRSTLHALIFSCLAQPSA